jgi:hypothetical protein
LRCAQQGLFRQLQTAPEPQLGVVLLALGQLLLPLHAGHDAGVSGFVRTVSDASGSDGGQGHQQAINLGQQGGMKEGALAHGRLVRRYKTKRSVTPLTPAWSA